MKNDIVVDILNFGYKNIHNGVKKDEVKDYLFGLKKTFINKSKKYDDLEKIKHTINVYFDLNFFIPQDGEGKDIGNRYFLNPDGYFRFLQYKSIEVSKKYSTLAIIIAIISIVLSLFVNSEEKIYDKQFQQFRIKDSIANMQSSIINERLNVINTNISILYEKVDTINRRASTKTVPKK